jgi:uncharacterized protein (DUF849 family)
MAPELYRETVERIRGSGVDVILNLTTGPAPASSRAPRRIGPGPGTTLASAAKRVRHILDLRPENLQPRHGQPEFRPPRLHQLALLLLDMARAIRRPA